MFCTKCGTENENQASFCKKCGTDLRVAAGTAPRVTAAPPAQPATPVRPDASYIVTYAGFWKRFAALIIDDIVMGVVVLPLYFILGLGSVFSDAFAVGSFFFVYPLVFIGQWLYYALMESSSKQGTLGKMALSIIVTDMEGNRISFGKATGRYFGRILSGIILAIGFLMIAFTERKQGLHDMLANTLVVDK